MKHNIRTLVFFGSILALDATAQAQTPITGWGLVSGSTGGWTVTDNGSGNFSAGGSAAPTGNTIIDALFTPITLGVGNSILLTGSFNFQGNVGSLGGGNFRFGIADLSGLGTLSSGVWSGSATGSGYTWGLPTGGTGATGTATTEISGHNGTGSVISWNGGAYSTTRVSGGNNNNTQDATADTYAFSLEYTLVSANVMNITGSFVGAGGDYTESVNYNDNGGNGGSVATKTFNSVDFFVSNSGTTATGFNFSNVSIQALSVPEPASMALLGLGALVGTFMARRRSK